jgi:hypothetical protein
VISVRDRSDCVRHISTPLSLKFLAQGLRALRGVCPKREPQILRSAQDDKRGGQGGIVRPTDAGGARTTALATPSALTAHDHRKVLGPPGVEATDDVHHFFESRTF